MKPSAHLAIAALICVVAAPGCKNSGAATGLPQAAGSEAPAIPVPAAADEIRTIGEETDSVLRATGSTFAIDDAELGPKSGGVLARVNVDEGDRVRKGQVLFTLDAAQASLMVAQARASVQAAEVNRARAQLDFDRTKPLYERGAVPPATFDQVRLGLDQAKVAVLQANVALSTAQRALSDTAITSPLRGVVTKRFKNPGETVTMTPSTTVLVVQDVSKIEIRVNLPESAMGSLRAGDSMTVNFRALGEAADVPITRINPSIDARARTLEVIAVIDNADGRYKAGMLVECSFPKKTAGKPAAPAASAGRSDAPAAPASNLTKLSSTAAPPTTETVKAP